MQMGARKEKHYHTSSDSQRSRIMSRLREGAATTLQLRRDEDVLMPAARIFELRHKKALRYNSTG